MDSNICNPTGPNTDVRSLYFNREVLEEKLPVRHSFKNKPRLKLLRDRFYPVKAKRMNFFLPFMNLVRLVYSGFQMSYNGLQINCYINQSCLFKAFFTLDMFNGSKKVVNNQFPFSILAT